MSRHPVLSREDRLRSPESEPVRVRAHSSTNLALAWYRNCFGIYFKRMSTVTSSSVRTWSFAKELNIERQGARTLLPATLSEGSAFGPGQIPMC